MLLKKLGITLIIFTMLAFQTVHAYAIDVYVGGQSIGIKMNYEGVLITGTYDISVDNKQYNPSSDDYRKGDLIIGINNTQVLSITDLMDYIEHHINSSEDFILKIKRDNKVLERKLVYSNIDNQFSTGLYVQEGISGIGTVTYYNPNDLQFGALGHIMGDTSTSRMLKKGSIYNSYVNKIKPSLEGNPGEKIAKIGQVEIGKIIDNNQYGIFGTYDQSIIDDYQIISTGTMEDVTKGKAYFLTVIDGYKIEQCDIVITQLKPNNKSGLKGITFRITDKDILEKTNGVIQGMSGSPIIQNGKLIGAVTHVIVDNPNMGYAIFIESMLDTTS